MLLSKTRTTAAQATNHRASHWLTFCFMALAVTLTSAVWASGVRASSPPDGRAYELVSPPDKNGGDVIAWPRRIRTASDGSAAVFSLLTATDDAIGTGVATEYVSQRTGTPGTRGWSTQPITPAQPPMSFFLVVNAGVETMYRGDISPDLTTGVLNAWSPLTNAPNVANVANLYLRTDLRAGGAGSYQLISDCPICTSPFPATDLAYRPSLIWASQDFGHVLFESQLPLTAGTAGLARRLYEWSDGTVRLAGILPSGTPSPSSEGGGGASILNSLLGQRAISEDGSKVFFSAPSGDGALGKGKVYMRLDGSTTVQLNRSERTPHDVAKPALLFDVTSSGSRAFFTSQEALTDDAPVGGDRKLYVYDATKPDSDPHNLTYLSADASGTAPANDVSSVIGASADGSTVYFVSNGQIVAGEPALTNRGIFVSHDGTVSFVAPIQSTEESELSRATGTARQARVSENGDLLFSTHGPVGPTGYDHGSCDNGFGRCRELYLYRLATHTVSCVSCNPSGAPGTSDAAIYTESGQGGSQGTIRETRAISADGASVYFSTADALVPGDVNDARDVYEYDAASAAPHLISTGTDPSPSYFMDATADGHDVFFVTRQRLVGWDVDQGYDLYDARGGGGFPEPPSSLPACTGDSCQGTLTAPPGANTVGSAVFNGAGNATEEIPSTISGIQKLSSSDRSILAKGGKARLRLKVNGAGTVTVAGTAKLGKKHRRVVSARANAKQAGAVSIPFALSRSARSALSRKRSLTVRLTVRFKDARPKVVSVSLKSAASKRGGRS
jgi:hypothetical protein